jgi:hypothetical protein
MAWLHHIGMVYQAKTTLDGKELRSSIAVLNDPLVDEHVDPISLSPIVVPYVRTTYALQTGARVDEGASYYNVDSMRAWLAHTGTEFTDPKSRLPLPVPPHLVTLTSPAFTLGHVAVAMRIDPLLVLGAVDLHELDLFSHRLVRELLSGESYDAIRCVKSIALPDAEGTRAQRLLHEVVMTCARTVTVCTLRPSALNVVFTCFECIARSRATTVQTAGLALTSALLHPSEHLMRDALDTFGALRTPSAAVQMAVDMLVRLCGSVGGMDDDSMQHKMECVVRFGAQLRMPHMRVAVETLCEFGMPNSAVRLCRIAGCQVSSLLQRWPTTHLVSVVHRTRNEQSASTLMRIAIEVGFSVRAILEAACAMRSSSVLRMARDVAPAERDAARLDMALRAVIAPVRYHSIPNTDADVA